MQPRLRHAPCRPQLAGRPRQGTHCGALGKGRLSGDVSTSWPAAKSLGCWGELTAPVGDAMKPVAAKLAQEIVADHFGSLPDVRALSTLFMWAARQTQGDGSSCVRVLPPGLTTVSAACLLPRLLSGPFSSTAG